MIRWEVTSAAGPVNQMTDRVGAGRHDRLAHRQADSGQRLQAYPAAGLDNVSFMLIE
jgi:hypothetical protein